MKDIKETFTRAEVIELLALMHGRMRINCLTLHGRDESETADKKWQLWLSNPIAYKLSHDELITTLTRRLEAKAETQKT